MNSPSTPSINPDVQFVPHHWGYELGHRQAIKEVRKFVEHLKKSPVVPDEQWIDESSDTANLAWNAALNAILEALKEKR